MDVYLCHTHTYVCVCVYVLEVYADNDYWQFFEWITESSCASEWYYYWSPITFAPPLM